MSVALTSKMITNHTAELLNPVFLENCRKTPELGPSILFFSGGSALREISRTLKQYSHNSIHMVTPFDSGGSSAELRQAFSMPSVGDLRSRLVSLEDENINGHPQVYSLFSHRLSTDGHNGELMDELTSMINGTNPMVQSIPDPMQHLICTQLKHFQTSMPKSFDLRGASIGNLILTGGYLNNHEHLDPIIFLFEKLVGVQGTVRAVTNNDLHLAAELEDGTRVVGQHLLTGKEAAPLTSPIKRLSLSRHLVEFTPAQSQLRKKNHKMIQKAELICYPPGSFYSSLVANLLPQGVGTAIAANDCPKVYIPNLGHDPEQIGMNINSSLQRLTEYLRADIPEEYPTEKVLNFMLIDSKNGSYPSSLSNKLVQKLNIQVIDTPLISKRGASYYDAKMLVSALLSLT